MSSFDSAAMRPVLLLIPGMLNTSRVWNRMIPYIHDSVDIRVADVTQQSSISKMAYDALALVADVPEHQRLVVCGFSMGGYVALDLIESPELAKRPADSWALALVNTSARPETADGIVTREKTIRAFERDFEKVIQGVAAFSTQEVNRTDESMMSDLLSMMRDVGDQAAIRQVRAAMGRKDHRKLLTTIQASTLVVSSRSDLVVPPDASEELASLIPHAKLEWIESAAHMTPLEQPARLATLLNSLF